VPQPQPWDTNKVAVAVAQASALVESLRRDDDGNAYRVELERVIDEALPSPLDEDFVDRLAYLVYGFTVYGLLATEVAVEFSKMSREQVHAILGSALDAWLAAHPST
jgi:hypothetical protein